MKRKSLGRTFFEVMDSHGVSHDIELNIGKLKKVEKTKKRKKSDADKS